MEAEHGHMCYAVRNITKTKTTVEIADHDEFRTFGMGLAKGVSLVKEACTLCDL